MTQRHSNTQARKGTRTRQSRTDARSTGARLLTDWHWQRPRLWGVWGLALLALGLLLWSDADRGLYTGLFLTTLLTGSIALAYAHLLRKTMLDYLDLREYVLAAKGEPVAAGLVVLAVAILLVGLLHLFGGLMHDFSSANSVLPMGGSS
jgi:hypothetical protein